MYLFYKEEYMKNSFIVAASWMVIFLVGLGTLLLLTGIKFSGTGNGSHTGYITAVESSGYIFRNYVVYVKTDLSSSQEDKYCVHRDNSSLADTLKKAAKLKVKITVNYHGVRGIGFGLCDGEQIDTIESDSTEIYYQ